MAFVPPAIGAGATAIAKAIDVPGVDPLSLGPVTFTSLECPEKPPIGGVEDKAPVIELIGGGRVVHSVGAQPQDVEWSARFLQPNTDQKVATLRAMAVSGQEYLLSWRSEQWYCKIVKFIPKHRNANYREYDIVLRITRDNNGALTITAPTSIDAQIAALAANAQSQATAIGSLDPNGSAGLAQPLATMYSALGEAGPIAQLSGSGLSSVQTAIAAALVAVSAYAAAISETESQYVVAQQLATSVSLISTFVAQGQSQNTLIVQGATMFEVASQVYGDPSLAFALAAANGLPSPFTTVSTPTQIVLPPFPKAA